MDKNEINNEIKRDKIFSASSEELDIIGGVGAKNLTALHRKYTPVQIKVLEERARLLCAVKKLRTRLHFWEKGIVNNLKVIIPSVFFTGFLGYFFGDKLFFILKKVPFNPKVWGSILAGSYAGLCFNIYDIGRLNVKWKKFYEEEEDGIDENNLLEIIAHGNDDEASQWIQVKNLKKVIGWTSTTNELGKLLKDYGFAKRRTNKGVEYHIILLWDEETDKIQQ